MKGILGRKIGMTEKFTVDGKVIPVTVIEVEPNVITQVKDLLSTVKLVQNYNTLNLRYGKAFDNMSEYYVFWHYFNDTPEAFAEYISKTPKRQFYSEKIIEAFKGKDGVIAEVKKSLIAPELFNMTDLFIKNGPSERRRFVDMELCQLDNFYLYNLNHYNKIVNQRNKLLKDLYINPSLRETLNIWDMQLVSFGSKIIERRIKFVDQLNEIICDIHKNLSGGKEFLKINGNIKDKLIRVTGNIQLLQKYLNANKDKLSASEIEHLNYRIKVMGEVNKLSENNLKEHIV